MFNDGNSTNRTVRQFFRCMSDDRKEDIEVFCSECLNRNYTEYEDEEVVLMSIDSASDLVGTDVFTDYSGYNFRNINNAMRGRWNYDENGHGDYRREFELIGRELSEKIEHNQSSIGNVKVFRGVTLDYFKDYSVTSLTDLKKLEGQFLIDKGFVSTSLIDRKCFFKKENELGLNYNIKIEYLVPEEFEDGICIGRTSYNPEQCEYLINSYNVAKVYGVSVNDADAVVKAVLVPKMVYDDYYAQDRKNVK